MKKRKPYKLKKPVRRVTSTTKIRRRRKPPESKFLQGLAKSIRLMILFAICAFLVYSLFKPEKKKEQPESAQPARQKAEVDTTSFNEDLQKEPAINLDTLTTAKKLDYWLDQIFKNYNIKDTWVKKSGYSIKVQLPADLSPIEVIVDIIQKVNELGMNYTESQENLKQGRQSLTITSNKDTMKTISFFIDKNLQRQTTKIAVIIDDFGYYDNTTTLAFLRFNYSITLSVLPGQKYSKKMAQQAREYHKQIMLHLPMEPEDGPVEKDGYTILTSMSDDEITNRIKKALKSLPDAIAVNNHMGSKATADEHVMEVVFSELKKQHVIFVDSRTNSESVAEKIAEKYNLPFAERTIFMDGGENRDKTYILNQIRKAAKIAEVKGKVLIIGHPYQETIEALIEELPKLEKKGIEIVSITKYIK